MRKKFQNHSHQRNYLSYGKPMKVCEKARFTRSKICKESSYSSPTYG
ncbi:transposase [Riemerella anatipestifer]|nr:transposase [Riemerella anatipestifer]